MISPKQEIPIQCKQNPEKEENKNENIFEEPPITQMQIMNGFSVLPIMNNFMLPPMNFGFNLNAMPSNLEDYPIKRYFTLVFY